MTLVRNYYGFSMELLQLQRFGVKKVYHFWFGTSMFLILVQQYRESRPQQPPLQIRLISAKFDTSSQVIGILILVPARASSATHQTCCHTTEQLSNPYATQFLKSQKMFYKIFHKPTSVIVKMSRVALTNCVSWIDQIDQGPRETNLVDHKADPG